MFVGRTLYLLGMAFVFFSMVVLMISLFSNNGGDSLIPLFGLLNGLIAMGVGDLVIDVNHRQRLKKMK